MNQKNSLWGGISILAAAVIAVLAFVRGRWMTPLLLAVFALWGLWAVQTHLLPAWRSRRRGEPQGQIIASAPPGAEMAQALLRHVNYRVSAQLKALYPQARWEWRVKDPALLAVYGGIGRIRVYGVPDYEYADVELEPSGRLACALVKGLSAPGTVQSQPPQPPNQQTADPEVWYETQGRRTLEALIANLDSRGHSCLTLKEDGSVRVQPMDGGEETVRDTLRGFPEKSRWAKLVKVLEQAGLAADNKAFVLKQQDTVSCLWAHLLFAIVRRLRGAEKRSRAIRSNKRPWVRPTAGV